MSEASKADLETAAQFIKEHYDEIIEVLPIYGVAEKLFLAGSAAGARALLEWARSKQIYGINIEGKPTPFGTVNLSDLEAYFAEEKK